MRKYNARVWTALLTTWLILGTDASDRHQRVVPLPAGKTVAVEITIGSVRIDGWDKTDVEVSVERHAPSAAEFERLPIVIDDTPERLAVRAIQADGGTDPAYRADVVLRLPRTAAIDRVNVLEGRVTVQGFSGSLGADVRRGPIEGRDVAGTLRLETGIGSVILTGARLSAGGLLRLRAFNGDVRLTLAERPPDARILALALNGGITSDIPLTMKDTWGPRWGEATLGKGDPVISLDVVTGTIEIKSR
jgi:hypothetical protein